MTYSGYIFDVEGTLVDSVPQALLSLQESLAEFRDYRPIRTSAALLRIGR